MKLWKSLLIVSTLFFAGFAANLEVLTPTQDQAFRYGHVEKIIWNSDASVSKVNLYFIFENGISKNIPVYIASVSASQGVYRWKIPATKRFARRARIIARGDKGTLVDTSASFVLHPAAPDWKEPNNSSIEATPLPLGEMVHKVIVMGLPCFDKALYQLMKFEGMDRDRAEMLLRRSFVDDDWYKIDLPTGNMITLSAVPPRADSFDVPLGSVRLTLLDTEGNVLKSRNGQIVYNSPQGGTYYCKAAANSGTWSSVYCMKLTGTGSPGNLTLKTPVQDQAVRYGHVERITWNSDAPVSKVSLSFVFENGISKNIPIYIASVSASKGLYRWKIPATKRFARRARIIARGDEGILVDTSDSFVLHPAAPDWKEPNNSLTGATPLPLGEMVHKVIVMGLPCFDKALYQLMKYEGMDRDRAEMLLRRRFVDDDWYKIDLPAGNMITLSAVPARADSFDIPLGSVRLTLMDAEGNALKSRNGRIVHNSLQGGTYYCKAAANTGTWSSNYCMKLTGTGSPGNLTLTTPVQDQAVRYGYVEEVKWNTDAPVGKVSLYFMFENGISKNIPIYIASVSASKGCYRWKVPATKRFARRARIIARGDEGILVDTSDSFVLHPAGPDAQEPNNTLESATPMALGKMIHKVIVMGLPCFDKALYQLVKFEGMDRDRAETLLRRRFVDDDIFKIKLSAGDLIALRAVPARADSFDIPLGAVRLTLMDANGNALISRNGQIIHNVLESGTYYCTAAANAGTWSSIYCMTGELLGTTQVATIDSTDIVGGGKGSGIKVKETGEIASVAVTMSQFVEGSLASGLVPEKTLPSLPGNKLVKAVSVEPSGDIRANLLDAQITIPYAESLLEGQAETNLVVKQLDPLSGEWVTADFEVNAEKNEVSVNAADLGIIAIFLETGPVAANTCQRLIAPVKANKLSLILQNGKALRIDYHVKQANSVDIGIYSLSGRLVDELANGLHEQGRYQVSWNGLSRGKNCSSGIYLIQYRVGNQVFHARFVRIR